MKNNRPRVGILLVTLGTHGPIAHLQMRGCWDYRNNRPQTWPGIHQTTVEGKVKDQDKDVIEALRRELNEEIGYAAGSLAFKFFMSDERYENPLISIPRTDIYYQIVPSDFFTVSGARPEHITGGFRPVCKADMTRIIVAKDDWRNKQHPHSMENIVVMPHVHKALQMLFKKKFSLPAS